MPLNSEASFSVFENSKFTQLYFLENFHQLTKLQHTIYQRISKMKWKTYNSTYFLTKKIWSISKVLLNLHTKNNY
jgi:hypothetical protein